MDEKDDDAAATFYQKRTKLAEYAATHPKVTDRAFRVGYWLSRRMNAKDRCCWYSKREIAKRMGKKPSYVERALADLRMANVMAITPQDGKVNVYTLHAPFF